MSTSRAGAQAARLRAAGLPPVALPVLADVDTIADRTAVAVQQPAGARMRELVARLRPPLQVV